LIPTSWSTPPTDGPPARRKAARSLQADDDRQGVLSTQVLQEFYVVAVTKLGMDPLAAKAAVRAFAHFDVVTVTPELIENAIDCSVLSQLSFWDGLILAAAEAACCDTLCTEDLQNGQVIRGVTIENPFGKPGRS